MKLIFSSRVWEDYLHRQAHDPKALGRINTLIAECRRHPFSGIGKPEPLKGNLAGLWSRRITGEHRLIYRVAGAGDEQALQIVQCRYHY